MLKELREERDRVEEAILSLERMAVGERRRGRPPAWMAAVAKKEDAPKKRGRPPGSKNRPKGE